jgi:hypothetical protein
MIRSPSTSCLCDKTVEVRLPRIGVKEFGDGTAALKDCLVEEVVVLAVVGDKLHAQRTGTSRLAPDGHLVSVTTKGGNIVLDPLESQALVSERNVASTRSLHFIAEEETPLSEAVVDGDGNDRLLFLDRLVNDVREVVSWVGRCSIDVALF